MNRDIETINAQKELFNVVQFFVDGTHEYVRRNVTAKYAVDAAYHYTHSVGALAGVTRRVIITDGGDMTCFEWRIHEGVVFPADQVEYERKDYKK